MTNKHALLDELHQSFLDRDLDRLAACFAAGVVFEGPGSLFNTRADKVASEATVLDAMSDLDMHVIARVTEGERVMEECEVSGRHTGTYRLPDGDLPPSGRRWVLRYMQRFDFADGIIVRQHIYWDRAALMEQLLGPQPIEA